MQTIVYYTLSACAGASCQPVTVQAAPVQPVPGVVYQAAPRPLRPLFAPRPQVFVIQSCAGGKCAK